MRPTGDINSRDWMNADGSAANTIDQLNALNVEATRLDQEKIDLTANLKQLTDIIQKVGNKTCSKGKYHGWIDSSGTYWCGTDTDKMFRDAIVQIPKLQGLLAANADKSKSTAAHMRQITDVLPTIAKSDPTVIAANAAATKLENKSENVQIIVKVVAGIVLAGVITWLTIKIIRARKGK